MIHARGTRHLRIGVVGGGASGALVAARVLRDCAVPVDVVVFEPRERLGDGVAYSTPDSHHLLNVPACGMSALPEDREHFQRWAGAAATDFVARKRYGDYLRDLLAESLDAAPVGSQLTHVREHVTNAGFDPTPWVVTENGTYAAVDHLVLATGHDAPVVPDALVTANLPTSSVITDPWDTEALARVERGDRVLLVGTGLTAIDVAVSLAARVRDIRIEAVSRHGLLPQTHEDPWRPGHPAPDELPASPHDVVSYVRSFGEDWRRGVDSLRSVSPAMWQSWDDAGRVEALHRFGRFWDVHRHRMAPGIGTVVSRLIRAGRLRIHRASLQSAIATSAGIDVLLSCGEYHQVDRIVVCTGPTGQAARDPLLRLLLARGEAQAGPVGLGLLVDPDTGTVVDGAGRPVPSVTAIGPLCRGVLGESTAMPEIRNQARQVARVIRERSPQTV